MEKTAEETAVKEFPAVGDGSGLGPSDTFYREEVQLAFRNRGMPLEGLRYDITPTGMHYLLVHFDIPDVSPADWRLEVGGMVSRPIRLSLEEIKARPATTLAVTMECAGNGRALYEPRPFDAGSADGEVYLILFGTGLRGATPGTATATLGGVRVPVQALQAQGTFAGLDQVNLGPLPREVAGRRTGRVDQLDALDLEAQLVAELAEQRHVALPLVAEVEVLAHDHDPGVEAVGEHLAHEVVGRLLAAGLVEGDDQAVVDAGGAQQLELLVEVGQQPGSRLGPHDRGGLPVERDHRAAQAPGLGPPPHLGDDGLVVVLPGVARRRFDAEIRHQASDHHMGDAAPSQLKVEFRPMKGAPLPLGDQDARSDGGKLGRELGPIGWQTVGRKDHGDVGHAAGLVVKIL